MGTMIFFCGVSLFIGFQLGWVNGYEQKEQDDRRIEAEMEAFWKGEKKAWATK